MTSRPALSPVLGKLIALALLGAIFAGAALLAAPVIAYHQTLAEAIDVERQRLGRLIAHEKSRDDVQLLERNVQDLAESGLFLEGGDDALKTAKLQEDIAQLLRQRGLTARSTRAIKAAAIGEFRRLGVEVELTARISELRDFLVDVGNVRPKLAVASMRLSAIAPEDPFKRDMVDVQLAVVGTAKDGKP